MGFINLTININQITNIKCEMAGRSQVFIGGGEAGAI